MERLDEEFFNGSGCQLAIRPRVRRVCQKLLCVRPGNVVWDIGAGTGSVSLVSALRNPSAHFVALEKSPEHYRILRRNIRRLGVHNVRPYRGEAPEDLGQLPSPDRVYLGGTGGRVRPITRALTSVLSPSDRLVASFLVDRNVSICRQFLVDSGFQVTKWSHEPGTYGSRPGRDVDEVYFLEAHRPVPQRFSGSLS